MNNEGKAATQNARETSMRFACVQPLLSLKPVPQVFVMFSVQKFKPFSVRFRLAAGEEVCVMLPDEESLIVDGVGGCW